MDFNNHDFSIVNSRAMELVEQVMGSEPYASMAEAQQMQARTALLPAYMKLVIEEQKEATKMTQILPKPPPYDPNVATALFE